MQGKRVACEDGSEGYSDLYQENAMLQRESDALRLRVKAMQETIDHLNARVTHLLANEVSHLLIKSSRWTSWLANAPTSPSGACDATAALSFTPQVKETRRSAR